MPTYEYHCSSCNATYELREGFSAATTHTCEECGKGEAKRVLVPPRIVFKGGGWYATDSRKTSTAVTEPASDGDSAAKTGTKADSPASSTPGSSGDAPAAAAS